MNTPEQSLLGKPAPYRDQYDPSLLYPIPRADKRHELGIGAQAPFFGADLWTAYELSWLTPRGKPVVADTRRAEDLKSMQVRTLVVHGKDDQLVPFVCGEDTARRIPRAQLVGIHGMGHDLPPGVVERLLQVLLAHVRQTGGR